MSKTTVVIPNYNGIKYLEACINSLQGEPDIPEIIVVDNGSLDGSREWVMHQTQAVKVIAFEENRGFSAAVNAGIEAACSEYVFLLNNDTVVENGAIQALEQALEKDKSAFAAAARMIRMQEPDRLDGAGDFYCALGWAFARGKDRAVSRYASPGRVFSACAGAALYRRSIFEETGLFDEKHFAYLEDLDVGYRANILGFCSIYVPEAVVFHAGSAVSGSRHNQFKVGLSSRNSIYLIYKNMPFLQVLVNLPFLIAGYLIKILFFTRKGLGTTYVKGLLEGFKLSFSPQGRSRKVKFRWRNLNHYLWIQWQLWINMLRFL